MLTTGSALQRHVYPAIEGPVQRRSHSRRTSGGKRLLTPLDTQSQVLHIRACPRLKCFRRSAAHNEGTFHETTIHFSRNHRDHKFYQRRRGWASASKILPNSMLSVLLFVEFELLLQLLSRRLQLRLLLPAGNLHLVEHTSSPCCLQRDRMCGRL